MKREVRVSLRAEIEALIRFGPPYLDDYVDSLLTGRQRRPSPGRLHGKAAELIRELALDVVTTQR